MIEHVEGLSPKLQPIPFSDGEILEERGIKIAEGWPDEHSAPRVSEGPGKRERESSGIEIPAGSAEAVGAQNHGPGKRWIQIGHIGILGVPGSRDIGANRGREGKPTLDGDAAIPLPATESTGSPLRETRSRSAGRSQRATDKYSRR